MRVLRLDNDTMYVMISYDISNDKLRRKIVKVLERYWYRVQKSVFECLLSESKYNKLKMILNDILKRYKLENPNLDYKNDSIRFYILIKNFNDDLYNIKIEWIWDWFIKIVFDDILVI